VTGAETAERILARASQLRQAGRVEEAIEAYQRYLALRPHSPNGWYNLAWLQRQARRFDAALASYARALEQDVAEPEEVRVNRAVILSDHLNRGEEAEAELRAALACNPHYLPALLNLGNLCEDRGRQAEAAALYARAADIRPDDAIALSRLASVTALAGPADPLVLRLRAAAASPRATAADRADLGFALGAALDAAGAYDEAFAAFADANAASRAAAGAAARYDRAAHEAFVDRLIAAFPAPAAPPPAGGPAGEAPIFICGMFRSGSTLAERILAAHSRVTAGGELDLLPALIGERLRPYPEAAAAAPAALLGGIRVDYLAQLRAIHPDARLVTDKRPDNFLHIGLIKRLFPAARIVHTVRSPLDNILSLWFLHLTPDMAYALDLHDAAHWHGQHRRLMAHWRASYADDIHDLDYDALVAAPRAEVERLLAFLGLEWEDSCLAFHEAPGAVRTASVWQVRQPLYSRSSGRWRNYARHLGPLREALGEE
jgi:tetratricopeptide (TPR) repeat protein